MGKENSKAFALLFTSLMVSFAVPFSHGSFTNEQDGKIEIPTFFIFFCVCVCVYLKLLVILGGPQIELVKMYVCRDLVEMNCLG